MGAGYQVDTAKLSGYVDKLSTQGAKTAEIGGLVDNTDVGDKSWGIVGIITKKSYTESLGELRQLLNSMKEGIEAASANIRSTHEAYRDQEDGVARQLQDIIAKLDAGDYSFGGGQHG